MKAAQEIVTDLTQEDLDIFRELPLWLQGSSICSDRWDWQGFVLVMRGWRVLGYRSATDMLRWQSEHRLHSDQGGANE